MKLYLFYNFLYLSSLVCQKTKNHFYNLVRCLIHIHKLRSYSIHYNDRNMVKMMDALCLKHYQESDSHCNNMFWEESRK